MSDPAKIAALNDRFRAHGPSLSVPGAMFATAGITALPSPVRTQIVAKVCSFDDFTPDNDPHLEHDFGAFEVDGAGKVFWKIDYYADPTMALGSEDPSDPQQSFRVMTLMLASEY